MTTKLLWAGLLAASGILTGCASYPPGAERGPHGTMAYLIPVEASVAGTKIYTDGHEAGVAPLTLKIYGDTDGTFHDFGEFEFVVQAVPPTTNYFVQTRVFRTGKMFSGEDRIPDKITFDMSQPPVTTVPVGPPPVYYYPPPAYYYGPPSYYFGPRVYIGPPAYRYHHRRW